MTLFRFLAEMVWLIFFEALAPIFLAFFPFYWIFPNGLILLEQLGIPLDHAKGLALPSIIWGGLCLGVAALVYLKLSNWIQNLSRNTIKPWFINFYGGPELSADLPPDA